jgi:hypothetical protein
VIRITAVGKKNEEYKINKNKNFYLPLSVKGIKKPRFEMEARPG